MDDIVDLHKLLSDKESKIATLQPLTRDKETRALKVRVRELKLQSEMSARWRLRKDPHKG